MDVKPKELHRLSTEAYDQLVKQLPGAMPHVSQDTSPHQAGYMLGIQMVLLKLREGFVLA